MIPFEVLEQARSELTDWAGTGMSVMEVSHRGKDFVACAEHAEHMLREVLGISQDYAVLFLQGGATGQFAAVPMNLTSPGEAIDVIDTGSWSKKAIAEAARQDLQVAVVADEADSGYTRVPTPGSISVSPGAKYLHYTANETIGGVEFGYVPQAGDVPVVSDFSSTILSRPTEVDKFGVLYAGTQKNMGPAGIGVVIVRRDLIGKARPGTPTIWDYAVMDSSGSMSNTPPTFGIYLLGLILDWTQRHGGLTGMAARNAEKAAALYAAIDGSDFYTNPVQPDSRSRMNIPFTLADPQLDAEFLAGAQQAGLANLKGHRSVGGMRASIYNAMPLAGVNALIEYMKEFERAHG